MSKFGGKGKSKGAPGISGGALPDIVFMILFFFMVSTTMRQQELKIMVHVPAATELTKLEKKSLVSYIYIGIPQKGLQKLYGVEPRIQLNDDFKEPSAIPDYIAAEREARDENERPFMFTSLKIDETVKMGVVTDVKQELRKANALKINYSARKKG